MGMMHHAHTENKKPSYEGLEVIRTFTSQLEEVFYNFLCLLN